MTTLPETDIASLHISKRSTEETANAIPLDGKVTVWRIENFEKVLVKPENVGHFYSGDSYIVLYSYKKRREDGTVKSNEEHIIYFWHGNDSSQDEKGSSAILATMLDDELGGTPIQVMVAQGKEPRHFRALFHGALVVHFGGVASGFKNVDDEDEEDEDGVALYHVHGSDDENTHGIYTKEAATSLTSRDCFVLINGRKVFLWQGNGSNDSEKKAAAKIADKLYLKFRCRGGVSTLKEGHEPARFWRALGGKGDYPKERHARVVVEDPRLFHCSNMTGFWQVEEVDNFAQSDLNDDDIMLLDTGNSLFLWIGAGSNPYEKRKGKETAVEYRATSNVMTKKTPIIEVDSGEEPPIFTQYFIGWDDKFIEKRRYIDVQEELTKEKEKAREEAQEEVPLEPTSEYAKQVFQEKAKDDEGNAVVKASQEYYEMLHGKGGEPKKTFEIDYKALHRRVEAEKEEIVDDGSGKVKIWRIENFERVEVEEKMYGQFYDGDSYIILYSYTVPPSTAEKHILYFWQGHHSSQDEKGSSAIETTWLDDELGGAPVQVRVTQGKEPQHFKMIFKGTMIIHQGGVASGFKNVEDEDDEDLDYVVLYHIFGRNNDDTIAMNVPVVASSLTSRDCFVLLHGRSTSLWIGKGSNEGEVLAAAKIASIISRGRIVKRIKEGKESASFWRSLGGKGEYASARQNKFTVEEPRLFKCSDALGAFKIEEIPNFTQEDLDNTDVMMLDTGANLYVWVGEESNDDEKEKSMDSAAKYLQAAEGKKRHLSTIVKIIAREEPPTFTQFFPGWDPELLAKTKYVDPYIEKQRLMKEEEELRLAQSVPKVDEKMIARKKELESAAAKEQTLSDEEFREKLKMSKQEFAALPKWKQIQKKKEAGLF